MYKISSDSLFEELDEENNKGCILSENEEALISAYRKLSPTIQEYIIFSAANAAVYFATKNRAEAAKNAQSPSALSGIAK